MIKDLRVADVCYSWAENNRDKLFFENISLNFVSGNANILCGPSGSGKSTIGLLLAGLIEPLSGNVFLNEKLLIESSGNVSYVFQFPEELFFEDTIEHEIKDLSHENGDNLRKHLQQLDFYLENMLNISPYKLSGGQARIFAIAMQMSRGCRVLIADEPTAGLDWKYQKKVSKLLKDWITQDNILIAITHDLELIKCLEGKSYAFEEGKIVWQGETQKLLQSNQLLNELKLTA